MIILLALLFLFCDKEKSYFHPTTQVDLRFPSRISSGTPSCWLGVGPLCWFFLTIGSNLLCGGAGQVGVSGPSMGSSLCPDCSPRV